MLHYAFLAQLVEQRRMGRMLKVRVLQKETVSDVSDIHTSAYGNIFILEFTIVREKTKKEL